MRDMKDRRTAHVYTARRPVDGEDWAAVAAALNERMAARRIGQQELAAASGVSVSTLRLVQHGAGRRVQNKTLTAIARALDWPDDHLIRILVGDRSGSTEPAERIGHQILATLDRVEQRLTEIGDRLTVVEQLVSSGRPARSPHGDGPDPAAG